MSLGNLFLTCPTNVPLALSFFFPVSPRSLTSLFFLFLLCRSINSDCRNNCPFFQVVFPFLVAPTRRHTAFLPHDYPLPPSRTFYNALGLIFSSNRRPGLLPFSGVHPDSRRG